MTLTAEQAIREIRAILYPEQFYTPEELDRQGIAIDPNTGVYQWDADTLDAIADVLKQTS